jgi:hypothetical protein
MIYLKPTHTPIQDRPEFHGTLIKSHIDGSEMIYFPDKKAQRLQLFSR